MCLFSFLSKCTKLNWGKSKWTKIDQNITLMWILYRLDEDLNLNSLSKKYHLILVKSNPFKLIGITANFNFPYFTLASSSLILVSPFLFSKVFNFFGGGPPFGSGGGSVMLVNRVVFWVRPKLEDAIFKLGPQASWLKWLGWGWPRLAGSSISIMGLHLLWTVQIQNQNDFPAMRIIGLKTSLVKVWNISLLP